MEAVRPASARRGPVRSRPRSPGSSTRPNSVPHSAVYGDSAGSTRPYRSTGHSRTTRLGRDTGTFSSAYEKGDTKPSVPHA
eukprot:2519221-Rhodomonas_salina.1